MAQVKYWQDGAAVGWNKIQHVNVEWLWSLSTAQQCHCQCRPNSTCTRARSLYFLRIWIWTNTFPVSARPAPITFVNSGGRLTLIRRRHSFTPSWCRVSIIAMQSLLRLRRQQRQATTSVKRCCTSHQWHQEVWPGTVTTDAPGVTLAGHSRASKLKVKVKVKAVYSS